jgi:hypothetical protein
MGFTNTDDACLNIFDSSGNPLPKATYASITNSINNVIGTKPALNVFVNGGYVIGTSRGGTDEVVKYFSGKGPAKFLVKPNVANGYLGYPVSRAQDYRTSALNTTDIAAIIASIIADGNLISQTQLYNPADFKSAPANGKASLIYLYQTSSMQNLTSSQQSQMDSLNAINLNFFGEVMAEYCYYKTMYLFLLNKYFAVYNYSVYQSSGAPDIGIEAIGGSSATSTADITKNVPGFTPVITKQALNLNQIAYYLACLNSRMVDINALLAGINQYYTNALSTIQGQIEASGSTFGSQKDVEKKVNALNASVTNITKLQSEADYRRGIIEYTAEKNRYSNILLGLYAFLNIAAIGIIMNLRQ